MAVLVINSHPPTLTQVSAGVSRSSIRGRQDSDSRPLDDATTAQPPAHAATPAAATHYHGAAAVAAWVGGAAGGCGMGDGACGSRRLRPAFLPGGYDVGTTASVRPGAQHTHLSPQSIQRWTQQAAFLRRAR